MKREIIVFFATLFFITQAYAASFNGLGDLPGGSFYSAALDISSDGTVVVGRSISELGTEAFRWSKEEGIVGIGDLSGGSFNSEARGVSADGSVVVGRGVSDLGQEAFRWTQNGGIVGLSDLQGGNFNSQADDVSADGLIVVGVGRSDLGEEAAYWTETTGWVGLGWPPGWRGGSNAYGVSADGSVIVGQGIWIDETGSYFEAVRWTESEGPVGIGELPGGRYYSDAWNISSDGLVVVGRSTSDLGEEAAYWKESTGWVGLGDLPGGEYHSEARGVSANGSVIVGLSVTNDYYLAEAFIWDETRGMRNLKDVLTVNYGLNLTGWFLYEATAVSDDGLVIVGIGRNPSGQNEAWIANISQVTYSCAGFEPPCDSPNVALTVKKNKCVPLKTELFNDEGLPVTDADIQYPPVLFLEDFSGANQPSETAVIDGLPLGVATDGNQFVFIGGRWCLNLKVKDFFTAPGTYTFKMVSGNNNEYVIEPTGTVTIFVQK